MRVWDIDPGFLNDRSLLGEHRELHALFVVIGEGRKGYAKHPETMRWRGRLGALASRHAAVVEEMALRGFKHRSPIGGEAPGNDWPSYFIDPPHRQYEILARKYVDKRPGRIALPKNAQGLWASHKYSIMARSRALYRETGPQVASGKIEMEHLALRLVEELRRPPDKGGVRNALLHMWGYISGYSDKTPDALGDRELLSEIREKAATCGAGYLLQSTALGEIGQWAVSKLRNCGIEDK